MSGDDLTLWQARDWCARFGELYQPRQVMVIRCHQAGMRRAEISAKTGLSRQTVGRWINEQVLRDELAQAAARVEVQADPASAGLQIIQARIQSDAEARWSAAEGADD